MLRIALISADNNVRIGGVELLEIWQKNSNATIWIDMEAVDHDTSRSLLTKYFDINKLVIDDAQRDRHPPKFEAFGNYFFLLVKAFAAETTSIDFNILHISFFVGDNFLLTIHKSESPSINKIWGKLESKTINSDLVPQRLCYKVIRTIIDRYVPIVLGLEKRLDELEDEMLNDPSDDLLSELIQYNSKLKKLRRIFGYQEKIFAELLGDTLILTDETRRHEFIDIHEQMERLASLSDLFQDLARDLIDGYISVTSHHLNKIMKVLTIATVIFLPLTFLAGIYGMNFEYMPELKVHNAYYLVVGTMVTIGVGLIFLFRKLRWL